MGDTVDMILPEIDQISTSYYIYKNVHSVCDLKNEFVNQKFINTLSEYHKVVIMLGILDIKNGVQAQAVFTNLIQSLRMIKSKIDIAIDVLHIPQISAKGKNYDVDIFNLRLTNMKTENRVEILKFDVLFNQPRYKVIDGKDGYTLLPEGAKIIASNINSKLIIPESKAVLKENKETISATPKIGKRDEVDQYTSEDEEEQKIIEILTVPEDLIGKIIGEPGTTIKSIIAKSKAFIKIDTFKERSIERDGAYITGTRESVTKAKEMIQRIADDTEPNKRKSRKQRKADKITTSKKTKSK